MKSLKSKTILFAAASFTFLSGCGANEGVLKSGKETPPSNTAVVSSIDQDLIAMRTADYRFIYVLRRKDGGLIDAEDRSIIRSNTGEAERRVSSDNERAFVIGSKVQIPPDNMMALYKHFAIEDHSPQPDINANVNANK